MTDDYLRQFKQQLVQQGLMREDEEFEHVNQVESCTRDQMWRMLHLSRGPERAFYLSVVGGDGSEGEMEDMEVEEEMTDGGGAALQAMEVDDQGHENAGDSQQTSSSKAMGEGSPTPRKAPLPLPLPTPSSKRSPSPAHSSGERHTKKPRLDTPPASNTQGSEVLETGIELSELLEEELQFEDDDEPVSLKLSSKVSLKTTMNQMTSY